MVAVTALLNDGALVCCSSSKITLCSSSFQRQCKFFPTQSVPREQQILHVTGRRAASAASCWEIRKINCLPWEPAKSLPQQILTKFVNTKGKHQVN